MNARTVGLWSLGCWLAAGLGMNSAWAEDWTRFRGPNGAGVSGDTTPMPVEWSDSKNLRWKVALPGPGSSSPIVVGDRVFVTCWSGYATDRGNPGSVENLKRNLICVDRRTGEELWSQSVAAVQPEESYRGMFAENGYASHTPVSDGERVYVFFGKTGVLAFDLEGKQLWQQSVGTGDDPRGWGTASSPILYNQLLIVPATIESRALVALDKLTGEVVWRQQADGFGSTWGTPVVVDRPDGEQDLVLGVPYEFWGINPENGKLRWYAESVNSDSMCSSVVTHDGVVYAIEGREGASVAVRGGGKGDVSQSHTLWKGRNQGRIGTPVYHDGLLYWINAGIARALDAATGDVVYQQRLEMSSQPSSAANEPPADPRARSRFGGGRPGGGGRGGQDYSSPVAADGKLYFVTRSGQAVVIKLGREFEQLATNRFESDSSDFSATPAISNGELFIRSNTHLYCVSQHK